MGYSLFMTFNEINDSLLGSAVDEGSDSHWMSKHHHMGGHQSMMKRPRMEEEISSTQGSERDFE